MDQIVTYLLRHGYYVLFLAVLARQLCLPVPGLLFVLAAGALAGAGHLNFTFVITVAVLGCVLADFGWYEVGRLRGNAIVHYIQGFTGVSDSTLNVKQMFRRYGVKSLLFSKFVVGLDAIAAPFAGMFGTSRLRFIAFDTMGSALWVGAYAGLGCAFNQQLDRAAALLRKLGVWMGVAILVGLLAFVVRRLARWLRFLHELRLARITPQELKQGMDSGEKMTIIDLLGCPYHPTDRNGIPGAIRINPHKLEQYQGFSIPRDWMDHDVVLYCSCPHESTSARVAQALEERGVKRVRPLEGGVKAWRDLGYPVSSSIPSLTMNALRNQDGASTGGTLTKEQLPQGS